VSRRDLGTPDLSQDPAAGRYVKEEVVMVQFADHAGSLESAVGINHYRIGDALIQGSTGDRWCVSRDRFDAKYVPCADGVAGEPGRYRNLPTPVYAKQMTEAFTIARAAGGDRLIGDAGDWVLEYSPGDFGLVDRLRFERVYRPWMS
jgi:hypothetical protein